MKQTVADLMGPQKDKDYPRGEMEMIGGGGAKREMTEYQTEQVFTVSLVLNPTEVEIIDQRVVIEKRVVARSRREALEKCGFTVKG